jgi:hypothetical protein
MREKTIPWGAGLFFLAILLISVVSRAGEETPVASTSVQALTITRSFPEVVSGQQGIATDGTHVYVQSTSLLAMYDNSGLLLKQSKKRTWHHGGIACHAGRIYAAASECCKEGSEKHWIVEYDAETLEEIARHDVGAHFTVCAGGIAYFEDHFYVAESYYDDNHADYIVQFDKNFQFVAAFTIDFKSPFGIQGLAYLPEEDKFMVNSHGKPFYLIDVNFDSATLEPGEAPFALQDIAHLKGTAFVLNDRPGRRIVFAELSANQKK